MHKKRPNIQMWIFKFKKDSFQVMDVLIKTMPQDDPVYQFMDRKRTQGKPYYVYMTAGANKFLRIYYGRVKEYLSVFLIQANSKLLLSDQHWLWWPYFNA